MDNKSDVSTTDQSFQECLSEQEAESDHDSVDSAQLLADIADVINSYSNDSEVDFFGKKNSKEISEFEDNDFVQGNEKTLSAVEKKSVENLPCKLDTDPEAKNLPNAKISTTKQLDFICIPEKDNNVGPQKEVLQSSLKDPVICLKKLDPSVMVYKVKSASEASEVQSVSTEAETVLGDKKIKRMSWYEEERPVSDMSDVSDTEEVTTKVTMSAVTTSSQRASKGRVHLKKSHTDKSLKSEDKNASLNSSHHIISSKDILLEKKGKNPVLPGTSQSPAMRSRTFLSSSNTQSKKNVPNSSREKTSSTSNTSDELKAAITTECHKKSDKETALKNTEREKKVTEKPKVQALTESRKRRLSKDEKGIETLLNLSEKNPKCAFNEVMKTSYIKPQSNWRYELLLSPFDVEDLSNEAFRKFVNLASDCAIHFDSTCNNGHSQGHVCLYFGCVSNMQSGMQKLSQLSSMSPKILNGVIRCHRIKPTSPVESVFKWNSAEQNWKRGEETKRKCAQIERIPSFVCKEMISLLFPFSLNVHSPQPKTSHLKKDSAGYTEIEFENISWMETILSCFRDFYLAKVGSGNSVWKFFVTNFKPPMEKIQESATSISKSRCTSNDPHQQNNPVNTMSKDSVRNKGNEASGKIRHSQCYQGRAKEASNVKGETRKRPYPAVSDNRPMKEVKTEKKSRIIEGSLNNRNMDKNATTTPQTPWTEADTLKTIAKSKGLDPNNADVLRILEVQSQLSSLQAVFSCTKMEETSLPVHEGGTPSLSQTTQRSRRSDMLKESLNSKGNTSISAAEQQLRDNIAKKQKQLKELEEKLKRKKVDSLSESKMPPPSRNDEPLDFTKPAPKIEEAVKQDEERSKKLAVDSSTSFMASQHFQGKRDQSNKSSFRTEDFALPLQFGKNVKKAIGEVLANKSKNFSLSNDQQSSEFGRRKIDKPETKERNLDQVKGRFPVMEERSLAPSKQKDMFDDNRQFRFGNRNTSRRGLTQGSISVGPTRPSQNLETQNDLFIRFHDNESRTRENKKESQSHGHDHSLNKKFLTDHFDLHDENDYCYNLNVGKLPSKPQRGDCANQLQFGDRHPESSNLFLQEEHYIQEEEKRFHDFVSGQREDMQHGAFEGEDYEYKVYHQKRGFRGQGRGMRGVGIEFPRGTEIIAGHLEPGNGMRGRGLHLSRGSVRGPLKGRGRAFQSSLTVINSMEEQQMKHLNRFDERCLSEERTTPSGNPAYEGSQISRGRGLAMTGQLASRGRGFGRIPHSFGGDDIDITEQEHPPLRKSVSTLDDSSHGRQVQRDRGRGLEPKWESFATEGRGFNKMQTDMGEDFDKHSYHENSFACERASFESEENQSGKGHGLEVSQRGRLASRGRGFGELHSDRGGNYNNTFNHGDHVAGKRENISVLSVTEGSQRRQERGLGRMASTDRGYGKTIPSHITRDSNKSDLESPLPFGMQGNIHGDSHNEGRPGQRGRGHRMEPSRGGMTTRGRTHGEMHSHIDTDFNPGIHLEHSLTTMRGNTTNEFSLEGSNRGRGRGLEPLKGRMASRGRGFRELHAPNKGENFIDSTYDVGPFSIENAQKDFAEGRSIERGRGHGIEPQRGRIATRGRGSGEFDSGMGGDFNSIIYQDGPFSRESTPRDLHAEGQDIQRGRGHELQPQRRGMATRRRGSRQFDSGLDKDFNTSTYQDSPFSRESTPRDLSAKVQGVQRGRGRGVEPPRGRMAARGRNSVEFHSATDENFSSGHDQEGQLAVGHQILTSRGRGKQNFHGNIGGGQNKNFEFNRAMNSDFSHITSHHSQQGVNIDLDLPSGRMHETGGNSLMRQLPGDYSNRGRGRGNKSQGNLSRRGRARGSMTRGMNRPAMAGMR